MKIATITGGTGGYALLRGLRESDYDISAIMSVFDSGGSSGILREKHGIFALGDLRRGFLALGSDYGVFSYLKKIAEQRAGRHCLGNLMLHSLEVYKNPGNLAQAERLFGMKSNHHVLPPSFDYSHLCAELESGETVKGEASIGNLSNGSKIARLFLEPAPKPNMDCVREIESADMIILGPGDLYTSIIPNILVEEVGEAVKRSGATKVFVCNTMAKKGETHGFRVSDFVSEIEKYAGCRMDFVLVNSRNPRVENDLMCKRVLLEDLVSQDNPGLHDSEKLSRTLGKLIHPAAA